MRYTTESYIEAAIKKHGHKYDYSILEYSANKPLDIICPEHGLFQRTSSDHINAGRNKTGYGCPTCGSIERSSKTVKRNKSSGLTQQIFLDRAREKHGDRYCYDLVVFTGIRFYVDIICKIHGHFKQMAQAHIHNGQGCPTCFKEQRSSNMILSKRTKISYGGNTNFECEARKIHGNKFGYLKTDILKRDSNGRVCISCPDHGDFFVHPSNHLKGASCQCCSKIVRAQKSGLKNTLTTPEYIERARAIHGERYTYSSVDYRGSKYKIAITCRTHGDFIQTASDHLHGNGCQKCSKFATSKAEQDWLTENKIDIRQKLILAEGRRFYVDGFDPKTNTIYEFLGDYWHGNPSKYEPEKINTRNKKKFGQLYDETILRLEKLKKAGYTVKHIWESDWYANNIQAR